MSASMPKSRRPTTPINAAKSRIRTVHVMPIHADRFSVFCDEIDMNRMMMCGIPKYPRPHASPDTMSRQSAAGFQ